MIISILDRKAYTESSYACGFDIFTDESDVFCGENSGMAGWSDANALYDEVILFVPQDWRDEPGRTRLVTSEHFILTRKAMYHTNDIIYLLAINYTAGLGMDHGDVSDYCARSGCQDEGCSAIIDFDTETFNQGTPSLVSDFGRFGDVGFVLGDSGAEEASRKGCDDCVL